MTTDNIDLEQRIFNSEYLYEHFVFKRYSNNDKTKPVYQVNYHEPIVQVMFNMISEDQYQVAGLYEQIFDDAIANDKKWYKLRERLDNDK